MSRKLVVWIPELADTLNRKISAKAESLGFETVFPESREAAEQAAAEAEILLTQDSALVRKAPNLRWVCTPSAGVDHFLAPGCFANPEAVLTNSSGAYGVTIAEHVIMVTLEMMRRRAEYNEIVRERRWERGLHIHAIHGSRAVLLGTGDIGRECAKRLRAFRPASLTGINRRGGNPEGLFDRVLTVDRLEEVLPETDLLILSLPDTKETRGVMSAERLAMLPETAYLVNVGRGSALDQKALEERLRSGKLAGASLDVFEKEPVPPEDSLWECPGLLMTPHIAGNMTLDYTVETIIGQFLEDLDRYAAGKPPARTVDRVRAY